MDKSLKRRIQSIKMQYGEPVKIFSVYRMPDGSVRNIRFKRKTVTEQIDAERKWVKEHGATFIDLLVVVEDDGEKEPYTETDYGNNGSHGQWF